MLAFVGATALPAQSDAQTPQQERGRKVQPGPGAQARGPGGDPAARIIELREELSLTDAQVAEINSIRERLRAENAPLMEQMQAARAQMREERPQPTPEQVEQMRARRDAMHDSMRGRADRMREQRATMTPEQRAEMQQRMRAEREQREGEMRARAGTARQDRMPEELRPVMEQLQANTRKAVEQVHSVLTPEQQEKLRELRPEQRRGGAMMRGDRRGPQGRSPGAGAIRR